MPRRKLARRFEPRFGVSDASLAMEANWLAKEVEDYGLMSMNDLQRALEKRKTLARETEASIRDAIEQLATRERLIMLCLLWRDFVHIAKLYEKYLDSGHANDELCKAPPDAANVPQPSEEIELPFKESLFE